MSTPRLVERAEERGKRFAKEDRYVLVLVLIVASIISTAFVSEGTHGVLIPLVLMSVTLLITLSTSDAGPKTQLAGRVVVVVAFAIVGLAGLAGYVGLTRVGFFVAMVALSLATPVVIARRLWQHPTISANTIAGAADIYLLIGLLFTVVYALIGVLQAGHLDAGAASTDLTPHAAFFYAARPTRPSDFVYFSLVTLTTVGYGDLTATSEIGRLLSNIEALVGQLYLVTVVAVLVSNVGRSRRPPQANEGDSKAG